MTLWDLRQAIESAIPLWAYAGLVVVFLGLVIWSRR